MTSWKDLQPGYVWTRRITPEMTDPEGDVIEIACKTIGEKGQKKIRKVIFDREFCFQLLDRLFQNLSKEQVQTLIFQWAANAENPTTES